MNKSLRLHLGAGHAPLDEYLNVDIEPLPGIDLIVDLNKIPWPWETGSVDEVFSQDCFEHLYPLGIAEGQRNIIALLTEVHRILKPNGLIELTVPSTDGRGAFQDPTHITYWNRNTFLYFVDGTTHYNVHGGYPRFSVADRNCKIGDTEPDTDIKNSGVIWTVARMRAIKEVKRIGKRARSTERAHTPG